MEGIALGSEDGGIYDTAVRSDNDPLAVAGTLADISDELVSRVRHEIQVKHDSIKTHVDAVRTLSDREIYACSDALSRIIDGVRGIIDQTDDKVRSSGTKTEALTQNFISKFRVEADAQAEAVRVISECALSIEAAVEYVDKLRYTSEILATNALIEAAHLGKDGRAFSEIAQQLRDQSKLVKSTTANVQQAVDNVRDGVIGIVAGSDSIQENTNLFISEMQDYLQESSSDAADGGDNTLDLIVQLSNQALSHLQFQDPMVQRLGNIEKDIANLLGRVEPILRGATDFEDVEEIVAEPYANSRQTVHQTLVI
jgi:methyl-accepting chemotaxis protein